MARSFYDIYKTAKSGEVQKAMSEITEEIGLLTKVSHRVKSRNQKIAINQEIDTLTVWRKIIKEDFLEANKE